MVCKTNTITLSNTINSFICDIVRNFLNLLTCIMRLLQTAEISYLKLHFVLILGSVCIALSIIQTCSILQSKIIIPMNQQNRKILSYKYT